jgi:phospho-N-acetylmuramoyl-pentapeptide-transferase
VSGLAGLLAVGGAFGLTLALTPPLIGWLRANQFGKAIRADGPAHQAKAGVPTMGGLALLASVFVVGLALHRYGGAAAISTGIPTALVAMALFAGIGLLDDLEGLVRKGRLPAELGVGLGARRLFALQLVAGALVVALLARSGALAGGALGGLVALVAVVGTANGLNMSDGLDGLAAGLSAIAFAAAAVAAAGAGAGSDAGLTLLSTFALAVAAACLAFLVYNRHPARVIMGNVTSFALGGMLATVVLASIGGRAWLVLPVLGFVFVAEVASVLLQVGYFKSTGGRRVFRMAPIHHHFELGGMPETQVVRRFWLVGLLAGLAGIAVARL